MQCCSAMLHYVTLVVLLLLQSTHCQRGGQKSSDETSVESVSSHHKSYWEETAPDMVNLLYTWFSPARQTTTRTPPVLSVTQPTDTSVMESNSINNRPHGSLGVGSNNNRPQGSLGVGSKPVFHPHFGLIHSWETTSKITRLSANLSIIERGRFNDRSYAMYYSKWAVTRHTLCITLSGLWPVIRHVLQ